MAKGGPPWERGYWLLALVSGIVMAFLVINKSSSDWEVNLQLITSNTVHILNTFSALLVI